MHAGIGLLVFVILALVLFGIMRYFNIRAMSALALALFFSLIVLSFFNNPLTMANTWQTDGWAQVAGIVALLSTLYILIVFLVLAFRDKDAGPNAWRLWA